MSDEIWRVAKSTYFREQNSDYPISNNPSVKLGALICWRSPFRKTQAAGGENLRQQVESLTAGGISVSWRNLCQL